MTGRHQRGWDWSWLLMPLVILSWVLLVATGAACAYVIVETVVWLGKVR